MWSLWLHFMDGFGLLAMVRGFSFGMAGDGISFRAVPGTSQGFLLMPNAYGFALGWKVRLGLWIGRVRLLPRYRCRVW
jgi:hypothetical protein